MGTFHQIKDEVYDLDHVGSWFFDEHLLGVEENAKFLLDNLKEADEEIVIMVLVVVPFPYLVIEKDQVNKD